MSLKLTTAAKKIKVTLVIDSTPFAALRILDNAPARTEIAVAVGGRTLTADVGTKAIRKIIKTLADHGADKCVLILQGALGEHDRIEEAGLTAQVKAAEPQASA